MFKLIKTKDFFFCCYAKSQCLFYDEEHNGHHDSCIKSYRNKTCKLKSKLSESAAVENTGTNFRCTRNIWICKKSYCNCSPDTVETVNCNSTYRVIDVKYIIKEPYTEDYKKTSNNTDDCSTRCICNITRSCDCN